MEKLLLNLLPMLLIITSLGRKKLKLGNTQYLMTGLFDHNIISSIENKLRTFFLANSLIGIRVLCSMSFTLWLTVAQFGLRQMVQKNCQKKIQGKLPQQPKKLF